MAFSASSEANWILLSGVLLGGLAYGWALRVAPPELGAYEARERVRNRRVRRQRRAQARDHAVLRRMERALDRGDKKKAWALVTHAQKGVQGKLARSYAKARLTGKPWNPPLQADEFVLWTSTGPSIARRIAPPDFTRF